MVCPYYCFSVDWGTFALESKYAKDLGVYIFYDEKNDVFLDKDGKQMQIKGLKMLPRTGVLQAPCLVDAIFRHGGDSIVRREDFENTMNWPNYVKTKRQNIIMSGEEIIDNPQKIVELFGTDRVFFKTKTKNYSQIIDVEKLLDKEGVLYKAIKAHGNDDFIISDVVKLVEDEVGPLEYRGFVVEGQLLNISRVHNILMGSIPSYVIDKMKATMEDLKEASFPESYVVDLFVCEDEDGKSYVDVLECNPIIASGTYLYNSVFEAAGDLENKCPSKSIPVEKLKYGPASYYSFKVDNRMVPSICYELPGGFAADLISIGLIGKTSEGTHIYFDSSSNIDPSNIGPISNLDLLKSDSELGGSLAEDIATNNLSNDELFKYLRKQLLANNSNLGENS